MTLTDAQREAALFVMREAYFTPLDDQRTMDDALDALTDAGFVVLHRDDVETEVERAHIDFRDDGPWQVYSATSKDFPFCERTVTHHATPWEPITNPTKGANDGS